jgi:hypothetical protein
MAHRTAGIPVNGPAEMVGVLKGAPDIFLVLRWQ